jgi:hypothetical protein
LTPAHELLWQHVQPLLSHVENTELSLKDLTKDQFFGALMHQWHGRSNTWRLNAKGLCVCKKIYKYYQFDLPDHTEPFLNQGWVLVGLHRHMQSPYGWDARRFHVFDSKIALEIEMCGGDLSLWAQSFLK